jgi:hypothetical protein
MSPPMTTPPRSRPGNRSKAKRSPRRWRLPSDGAPMCRQRRRRVRQRRRPTDSPARLQGRTKHGRHRARRRYFPRRAWFRLADLLERRRGEVVDHVRCPLRVTRRIDLPSRQPPLHLDAAIVAARSASPSPMFSRAPSLTSRRGDGLGRRPELGGAPVDRRCTSTPGSWPRCQRRGHQCSAARPA